MTETLLKSQQAFGGDGWQPAKETWTYASADDPTYTFTISGDKTTKYSAGMRIKLTNDGSVKYFIITKVAESGGTTTITVYGGTDYDLANAAITANYYSTQKAPLGFPLAPTQWEITGGTSGSQSNPTANQYYNIGGNIVIPLGSWLVHFHGNYFVTGTSQDMNVRITLATVNNNSTGNIILYSTYAGVGGTNLYGYVTGQKHISLSSKTTYYLNLAYMRTGGTALNWGIETEDIRAVCAYL